MRPSLRPPWPIQTVLLRWHPRAPQSIPRRIATTSAANASPVDIPKLIVSPGSKHHNSLPSFLEYAKRTNLAPNRTVYVGTHYEYTSALSLMRLGFSLLRIGRSNDAGIDLIGHWAFPPLREPMPTIIQCKSRMSSLHPSQVRELEGSFQGIPAGWKKKDVLGLLVTTRKATKGVLDALGQSRWPMGFVLITRDGTIQQFVWNRAASERGLEGVGVTLRHTPRNLLPKSDASVQELDEQQPSLKMRKRTIQTRTTGTKKDIQLTWMGTPVSADRSGLTQDTVNLLDALQSETISITKEMYNTNRWKTKSEKDRLGRPRTVHKAPTPRGGLVDCEPAPAPLVAPKTLGRPKPTTTTPKVITAKLSPPQDLKEEPKTVVRKRGRPKGSKNKPKDVDG